MGTFPGTSIRAVLLSWIACTRSRMPCMLASLEGTLWIGSLDRPSLSLCFHVPRLSNPSPGDLPGRPVSLSRSSRGRGAPLTDAAEGRRSIPTEAVIRAYAHPFENARRLAIACPPCDTLEYKSKQEERATRSKKAREEREREMVRVAREERESGEAQKRERGELQEGGNVSGRVGGLWQWEAGEEEEE